MSKKIPIDRLQDEINKILTEYADDVQENIDNISKKLAKKGAQAIIGNASSSFTPTRAKKRYASGWTSTTTKPNRLCVESVIYNKTAPGLTHLLENGHALRQGGRTSGRAHIAPVEQMLVKEFEEGVKSKL